MARKGGMGVVLPGAKREAGPADDRGCPSDGGPPSLGGVDDIWACAVRWSWQGRGQGHACRLTMGSDFPLFSSVGLRAGATAFLG